MENREWEYLLDFFSFRFVLLLEMENYPVRLLIRALLPIPWEFCVTGNGGENTNIVYQENGM